MPTYAEKLTLLRQFVRQGQFGLGKGDIKGSSGIGGMETTRQVFAGILDLLGRTGVAGSSTCCCWEEVLNKTEESIEPFPGAGVTYVIQPEDLGKLLVFLSAGIADTPPPDFLLQDIQLPDASELNICTKVGITCVPFSFDIPERTAILMDPVIPMVSPAPLWTQVTSPLSPLQGLSPLDPNRPGILLGEDPVFTGWTGWFLLELVVSTPGDFTVPDSKGWWLKNIDLLIDQGGGPPAV